MNESAARLIADRIFPTDDGKFADYYCGFLNNMKSIIFVLLVNIEKLIKIKEFFDLG